MGMSPLVMVKPSLVMARTPLKRVIPEVNLE
jgi:hypothetical protein